MCARAAQYVIGTEKANKQTIAADAKAIFLSLESQFSLPPFCAAAGSGIVQWQAERWFVSGKMRICDGAMLALEEAIYRPHGAQALQQNK